MQLYMEEQRQQMVRAQLVQRGIRNKEVLRALATVPRHQFVPPQFRQQAYDDCALILDDGQTISQPYIVALMAEALDLRGHERVLEIGTGSGYAAAVLSLLAAEVITIERSPRLAAAAEERLAALGYDNVRVYVTDGTLGWPENAPYGGISVPAAAPWVPLPLREQLDNGGRLVIPIGSQHTQVLLSLVRRGDEIYSERLSGVRFVPLVGRHSWSEEQVASNKGPNWGDM